MAASWCGAGFQWQRPSDPTISSPTTMLTASRQRAPIQSPLPKTPSSTRKSRLNWSTAATAKCGQVSRSTPWSAANGQVGGDYMPNPHHHPGSFQRGRDRSALLRGQPGAKPGRYPGRIRTVRRFFMDKGSPFKGSYLYFAGHPAMTAALPLSAKAYPWKQAWMRCWVSCPTRAGSGWTPSKMTAARICGCPTDCIRLWMECWFSIIPTRMIGKCSLSAVRRPGFVQDAR